MYAFWKFCFGPDPVDVSLSQQNLLESKPICAILLGPTKTGKTKLLDTLSTSNSFHNFPSLPNVCEESVTHLNYLGREIPVHLSTTSDATTPLLIIAYINDVSSVLLTYDKKNLEHLRLLQERYLPLLLKHRQHSLLWIVFVGTTTQNNPYVKPYTPSLIEKKMHDFTLNLVISAFRKHVGNRVSSLEVVVDDYDSVMEFKSQLATYVLGS